MNKKLLLNVDFLFSKQDRVSLNKSNNLTKWLCLVLLFVVSITNAATRTSTATGGNWNLTTTWIGGIVPVAGDDVVISTGATVNTNGSRTCAGITILGTLSMANGNILTVNGNVSGNGSWITTGGGSQTISLTGNWSFTGTSAGTGAIALFTGTASQTLTGRISSANSGTLRINKTGGSAILGNALTVATFTNTSGIFDASTYLLTATTNTLTAGTLRVGAANWGTNYSFTPTTPPANFTIDYYNASPIINGAITYQNLTFSGTGTTASPSGNLTIQGNLSNLGGGEIDFNARDITINGGYTQSIASFTTTGAVIIGKTGNTATFTGDVTGGNLTINSSARLALGGFTHTFTGNWSMAGTIDANTSTLRVQGNIIGVSGSFNSDTGTVDLYGANQSIRKLDFYNLTLSGSGTKTFTAASAIGNNLEIGLGVNANLGTFTHTANTLTFGGAIQDLGSWGSTGSSANNKNDTYFIATGTGIVNVGKGYCTPSFTNVRPITNVVFNTITNASSALTSSPAYESFINYKTNVTRGMAYTISIKGNTNGNNTNYYTVFFDWNQNGIFTDSGESISVGNFSNSDGIDSKVATVSITVPTSALLGTTRMRVVSRSSSSSSSCGNLGNGQVEDYSVNIEAACSGTPAPGNTVASVNPVCPNVPFTVSVGNPTLGGATYQWETSPNGLDPWISATPAPVTIINTNFSTIPTNAAIIGNSSSITSGELILTSVGVTRYSGGYVINTTPGSNITPFTASFDYRIFDGVGGADGMSLSYGSDINSGTAGGGELGEGTGFVLQLDTYDNVTGQNTGSMIRILYGGVQIFANALNPFNLRNSSYRNVTLAVDANGTLSLKIAGVTIVSGLSVPSYVAADKTNWKFKFSARVGDINDKHSINKIFIQCGDILSTNSTLTTSQTEATHYRAKVTCGSNLAYSSPVLVNMSSAVITTQPLVPTATCTGSGTQKITVVATGTGLAYQWRKAGVVLTNGGVISGATTATLTLTDPIGTDAGSYDVVVTAACSSSVISNAVIVSVNTLPIITTQPQALPICEGTSGSFTVATSASSPAYQWQYATAVSGPWTNIDNTVANLSGYNSATLVLTDTPIEYNNYYVQCLVRTGACTSISASALLTVKPLPTTPTIGTITPASCTVSTGSVVLNGLPATGTWEIITNPVTITRTGSGESVTISGLAPNTYTFSVNSSDLGCTSRPSVGATISGPITNTWDGSKWSHNNTPPTIYQSVVFAGNYISANGTLGNLEGCSCTVNSGVSVIINSGATLTITNSVNVNTAINTSLTFENNASLVQTANVNVVNTGDITYKRISSPMKAMDYTYWSSPVLGQKFNVLSPNSDPARIYYYNTNNWKAEGASNPMIVGKGYIIRVPKAGTWPGEIVSYPYAQPVAFKGVPNNGNIQGETITAGNYYLVGNPYPSAINADKFRSDVTNNAITKGTLYFWTHNTAIRNTGSAKVYASDDYASYNGTGGTETKAADSPGNKTEPSGKIAAGQSFMVESRGAGTIVFNNGMRVVGENNQFFRPRKASKVSTIEKNRVWLNLINDKGAFKQILVGYIEGATNGEDNNFDGAAFNANSFVDFYSINDEKNYSIQGRALPFTDTDIVPLGYSSTIAGDFTIEINKADGSLLNQVVYLEDKTLGAIHNLTQNGYKFTTAIGTFDNRFALRYTNKTLGTGDFEKVENEILVSVANEEITINAISQAIDKVFIYDISGKLIYKKDKVKNPKLVIENLRSSNQVLLIKVDLENKHTETKKVIF
ncbi:GEVED domain-containing protein [Flavobacterium sp. F-65]|uniref:GEVED domain-containing protein n=1 Tax=Flavobacterium pisciphilum TaxID=2893755 RepID=A0ABS8MWP9_9FLAO|nr:GEVED domain-containing protein [Flavobacterium sp. F-65]MCC9072596.1 GEVED domain-containing protein [Flavobacterium sp. F-65]